MIRRIVAISLVLALLPVCASAEVDWLRRYFGQSDLSVTGSKTFAYRSQHVTGNRQMFVDDNYGQASKFDNETSLTVTGKLFQGLNVNASLTDNRWNPSQRVFTLGYQGRSTRIDLGDINASLTGNPLLPFNRRLKGIMVNQRVGKSSFTSILSQTHAVTRKVTTPGNNTTGPYYLGASRIIDGSERVKIDEREIPRTDSDGVSNYTLDSFSGILQFRDGLVVPQGSVISVSFESQSTNDVVGTLCGFRGDVPVGDRLNMGLTYLTQISGNRNTPAAVTEPIRGGNSPDMPYVLANVPEQDQVGPDGSMIQQMIFVKVDGLPQTPDKITPEGTLVQQNDYFVNYPLHYILFHRPIPATSVIMVTYFPKQDSTISGNRSVLGLDSTFRLSDNVSITSQFARSSANLAGDGPGGNALNLQANAKLDNLTMAVGLKNIAPSFASVDSTGFLENEKGGNMSLDYKLNDHVRFHTAYDRFTKPYSYYSGTETPYVDFTNFAGGVTVEMPNLPTVSLITTRLSNVGGLDSSPISNSLGTDALDIKWSAPGGKVIVGGGLSRNNNRDDVNPSLSSLSNTSKLNLQYLPGQKFSLSMDLSGSKITNADGGVYNAKNSQYSATFMPTTALSFTANYRISDSGNLSAYNYTGYAGEYGSAQNAVYLTSYGGKTVTHTLGMRFAPGQRFALDASLNKSFSEGDNTTNTSSLGKDFGLTLNPCKWLQFMGHISLQDMTYVGSVGSMGSNIGFFRVQLGPIKQFTLDLNYQRMISSTLTADYANGSEPFDFNLNSLTAELRRPIGQGRTAFLQYQSSGTTGYVANTKTVTALGVNFPVTKILGLTMDWRVTNYADAKLADNNYRANSLNVELGARFH